jgi:hypothetical protein
MVLEEGVENKDTTDNTALIEKPSSQKGQKR